MLRAFGIAAAVVVHLAILLFGGLLFLKPPGPADRTEAREVDLLTQDDPRKEDRKDEPEPEPSEQAQQAEPLQEERPQPPDMSRLLEPAAGDARDAPALEALSLDALADALNGTAGAGDEFAAGGGGLASGGRIGGTGPPGAQAADARNPLEEIFSIGQLDQGPRPVFQSAPTYPVEMRKRKAEGVVYVLFVVDADGRVVNPRIEKSSHSAFEAPALEAVRRWKFEPGLRGGQKVQCRMRAPIRFSMS